MDEHPGGKMMDIGSVTAPVVEVDDLFQGLHAAAVHIGAGQFDVAQAGNLERALDRGQQATLLMFLHFDRYRGGCGRRIVGSTVGAFGHVGGLGTR